MTVICYEHREEIEGAIRHCDDNLAIYHNFDCTDADCGPFQLWHPDWAEDADEKAWVVEKAASFGLSACTFYEGEEVAYQAVDQVIIRRALSL